MKAAKTTAACVRQTPTHCVLRVVAVTAAGATLAEARERAYALAATVHLPRGKLRTEIAPGPSRTQDRGVVTFVELVPEGGRPDDEQLRGWRIRTPVWLTRAPYLALGVVIVGAVLAGDSTSLVGSAVQPIAAAAPGPTAGFVYADPGPCPLKVSCELRGQARIDLWASYNHLFPDTQTIGSNLWYAPATGTVYRQELDAMGPSGDTIILTQQRISGSVVPFGPRRDRSFRRPHYVLVSARRGPWLVTAALYPSRSARLPIMAALAWVATSPLPG